MQGLHASGNQKLLLVVVSAVVLLLVMGTVTMAQQQRQDRQQRNQQTNYIRANDLTGKDVCSRDGEEMGDFENIVFDENHQRVMYAVVAEGGFLGIGDDLHAIPWAWVAPRQQNMDWARGMDLGWTEGEDCVTLPLSEEEFEDTPGFETYPTRGINREIYGWQDSPPSPQEWTRLRFDEDGGWFDGGDDFEMRKATELVGLEVEATGTMYGDEYGIYDEGIYDEYGYYDDEYGYFNGYYDDYGYYDDDIYYDDYGYYGNGYGYGEVAGEISDLLISSDGRLDFAIVEAGEDFLGIGEENFIAVPWARITVYPEAELATADLTTQEARSLVIGEDEINRLNEPNFRDQFYSAVGVDYYVWVDAVERGEQFTARDQRQQQRGQQQFGQRQQRRQPTQQRDQMRQEIQRWSDFTQQCLGRNLRGDQRMRGEVMQTGMLRPGQNADAPPGQSFTIRTRNNERMTVYLGPEAMIPQNFNLNRGSQVEVRGSQCRIDNREVFVATQISTDGQQFNLRQRNGTPHWETQGMQRQRGQQQRGQQQYGQRQQQRQYEPQRQRTRERDPMHKWSNFTNQCLGRNLEGDQRLSGEVQSIGTMYTPQGSPAPDGRRFTVTTQNNERVTVFAGPSEVATPLKISRGDRVTIRGSQCQVNGKDVLVATRIETDGQVFTLEDRRGTPQWMPQDRYRQDRRR